MKILFRKNQNHQQGPKKVMIIWKKAKNYQIILKNIT